MKQLEENKEEMSTEEQLDSRVDEHGQVSGGWAGPMYPEDLKMDRERKRKK